MRARRLLELTFVHTGKLDKVTICGDFSEGFEGNGAAASASDEDLHYARYGHDTAPLGPSRNPKLELNVDVVVKAVMAVDPSKRLGVLFQHLGGPFATALKGCARTAPQRAAVDALFRDCRRQKTGPEVAAAKAKAADYNVALLQHKEAKEGVSVLTGGGESWVAFWAHYAPRGVYGSVWKSTSASGAPDTSSQS